MRYCLPIIEKDKSLVTKEITENLKDYSAFEIWLDYIDEIDNAFVQSLSEQYGDKLIFLFRRLNLEQTKLELEFKKDLIRIISSGKSFIDLDIFNQSEELKFASESQLSINLICSYHNHSDTPSLTELIKIVNEMRIFSPQIFKIACLCRDQSDALLLLEILLKLREEQKKYIILGMGKEGLIARIFSSLWGNELVFAPLELSKATANGQFTMETYEKIFNLLK